MHQHYIIRTLIILIALVIAIPAHALNVQLMRPKIGAVQGYQLFTSETLPIYDLAVGMNFNYVHHPLEVGRFGGNQRRRGIVDRFVTGDFLASFGAANWAMINLDVPFNIYHDIAPTFIPQRDTGWADMGDIQLDAVLQAFDANKTSSHLGLAFVPFVTFPTGRESIYFGDTNFTGGIRIVGDAQWKSNRFYLNLGARFRESERIANLVVKHEFLMGAGFERPLWKKHALDVIVEVFGSTTFSKFFTEEISSPGEADLILRKKWLKNRRLITNIGGGFGFTNGYGAPDYRAFASVGYAFDLKKKEAAPPPVPEMISLEGVNFATASATIKLASYPILNDALKIIYQYPNQTVRIVGYTDSVGNEAANQRLSERRAKSVKQYFSERDTDPGRITAIGHGEADPIANNNTKAGRAKNRRIELTLK